MIGKNESPFSAIGFEQVHRDGQRMAVVAARVRYKLTSSGRLTRDNTDALVLSDTYEHASANSPLLRVSDLVPFRPFADVTLIGKAHAPEGKEAAAWMIGLRVSDQPTVYRVTGPREWMAVSAGETDGFVLDAPKACKSIAIDYRQASGGRVIGDPAGNCDLRNPIGAGLVHRKYTSSAFRYVAPTIEDPEAPVTDAFAQPEPVGFGPIPPSWQQRLQYAGTFDDGWLRRDHPRLPRDFRYQFYQVAHPRLIFRKYFPAGLRISAVNLARDHRQVDFRLPDEEPLARFQWVDGREVTARMNRDGLHIDMRNEPPWTVDVTFRVWIEICPRFQKVDLIHADSRGAGGLPASGEFGLEEAA